MSIFPYVLGVGGLVLLVLYIRWFLGGVRRRKKILLRILNLDGLTQYELLYRRVQGKDRSFTRHNFRATLEVLVEEGLVDVGTVNQFYCLTRKGRAHLASL